MSKPVKEPRAWFDRWPGYFGSKVGACDVLVTYKDGMQKFYPSNGCHGIMYNVSGDQIDRVYSSLWCRLPELFDAAKEYWGYLLDPEKSPFKRALPNLEMVYDSEGRPLAFGLLNQDVPNQLCVPLMMQCRVPQENTNKLRAFKFFRENGFDVVESFYLSEHFYYIDGFIYKVNNAYVHAFDPVSYGIDFKRLKESNPAQLEENMTWNNGSYDYTPVTAMWSSSKKSKIYEVLEGNQPYTGVFPQAFKEFVSPRLKFPKTQTIKYKEDYVLKQIKNLDRSKWC